MNFAAVAAGCGTTRVQRGRYGSRTLDCGTGDWKVVDWKPGTMNPPQPEL